VICHIVEIAVSGVKAEQFYDFMINPDDRRYNEWWPEEHLQFHIVKPGDENHHGDEVFFSEFIGEKKRLAFYARVTKANRPNQIEWQMKYAGIRLPAFLNLDFFTTPGGIKIKHELRLGFSGLGRIIDAFIRLYFSKSYKTIRENARRLAKGRVNWNTFHIPNHIASKGTRVELEN
jgi:hypothetical protein